MNFHQFAQQDFRQSWLIPTVVSVLVVASLTTVQPAAATAGGAGIPSCSDQDTGWFHAEGDCDLLCKGTGFSGVHVITAAAPPFSVPLTFGANSCGGECVGPVGCSYAMLYTGVDGGSCAGHAYATGPVAMGVACWWVGARPRDLLGGAATMVVNCVSCQTHTISSPRFDPAFVNAGDQLCMNLDLSDETSPLQCLVAAPNSVTFFTGPFDFLPVGVVCRDGECHPASFEEGMT